MTYIKPIALIPSPVTFTPAVRRLVLVNARSLDAIRVGDTYSRGTYYARSNEWMDGLEAAITGRVTVGAFSYPPFVHTADALPPLPQMEDAQSPEEFFLANIARFHQEALAAARASRPANRYAAVHKIAPDQKMRQVLQRTLAAIAREATPNDLTVFGYYGHGERRGIEIGLKNDRGDGLFLTYKTLWKWLGQIPGKKVLLMSTCFSGWCENWRPASVPAADVAIIASTGKLIGMNWNEDVFHEQLSKSIVRGASLLHYRLTEVTAVDPPLTPAIHAGFDVVL